MTQQCCLALVLMETPAPPPLQQQNFEPQPTSTKTGTENLPAAVVEDNSTNQTKIVLRTTNSPSTSNRLPPPKRVELNKCCLFAEYLDKSKTCMPGATEKWIPLIYLINRKDYYRPQGSSPKFITFQDNVFPISQARALNEPPKYDDDDDDDENVSCTVDDLVLYTGTNNFIIFSNGSLFLPDRVVSIPPQRYCVDQQAALVCFPKPKHPEPTLKLKKCCLHGVYDKQLEKCQIDGTRNNQLNLSLAQNVSYQTIYGFPECKEGSTTYAIAGSWSPDQLLSDVTGHFHLPHYSVNLSSEDYCLENLLSPNNGSEELKVFACLHHFVKENNTKYDGHHFAAISSSLVISVIFLAATLVASYLMPSVHHVLHWRCQIYYVFCLFIAEFLYTFTLYFPFSIMDVAPCKLVASAMHFFFLAAFFWLNTMCFNIWWTFRDFRPSSLERNQEMIRLRLYSAYAWGIPLLITTIAACVDLVPESSLLRPGFYAKSPYLVCWFNSGRLPIFAYFFGPVGILLSINIMLFISTTHQLTCGLWKRDDVKSTTEKTALGKVCLKLVVVMGVTWIVDVLSWLIGGPNSAWIVTDIANALQGVFIFLVVGCQPQVWAACRRFCCPRSRQEITNTTNGVQHSSSSQGLPSLAACGGEITQNTSVHNTTLGGGGGGGAGNNSLGNHTPATAVTTTSTLKKIPMETLVSEVLPFLAFSKSKTISFNDSASILGSGTEQLCRLNLSAGSNVLG
ncbi:probable G-protein coupled receptor Mth-like 1, partial [Musca vetustissima]|uniref:probable G-protein coupled receptor Mth-like 1 n=1 Tax=Musca vetustissima TaxID=27455 RepID=UPI002AB68E0B